MRLCVWLLSCSVVRLATLASGARLAEHKHSDGLEVRVLGIVGNGTLRKPIIHVDFEMCYEAKIDQASNRGIWQVLNAAVELIGRIPGGVGFVIMRAVQPIFRYKDAMLDCEAQIMGDAFQNLAYKGTAQYNRLLSKCVKEAGMAILGLGGDESIRTAAEVFHLLLEHVFHDVELAEHGTEMAAEEGVKEVVGVVLAPLIAVLAVKEMVANALLMRTQFAYEEVQAAVDCLSAGSQGATENELTMGRLFQEIVDICASHLFPNVANVRAGMFRLQAAVDILHKLYPVKKLSKAEQQLYATTKAQMTEYLELMTNFITTIVQSFNRISESSMRSINRVRATMKLDFSTSTQLQEDKERKIRKIEIFKNPVTWLRGKIPEVEPAEHTGSSKERALMLADDHVSGARDLERLLALQRLQELEGNATTLDIPVDDIKDVHSVLHVFGEVNTANSQCLTEIAKYQDEVSLKIAECNAALDKAMAVYGHATGKIGGPTKPCVGKKVTDCTSHPWQRGQENGGCDKLWYKVAEQQQPANQSLAYQCQAPTFSYSCQPDGTLGGLLPCLSL